MRRTILSVSIAFGISIIASAANAQATRTWVLGVGDDANPCSRTAPCKTFAGAISKTATGGMINCLDPGGFGAVTITKSITLDCNTIQGSVLVTGTNGIVINSDNTAALLVRLRGIELYGLANSQSSVGLAGVQINGATTSNTHVIVEDCMIDGFTNGIKDSRTGGGHLTVVNTTVQNNVSTGILISASSSTRIDVALDNVLAISNSTGITAVNGARMTVKRSTVANSLTNGFDVEGATTQVNVDNTMIASNAAAGMLTVSSGTLRVSNSDISNNGTAANGAWISFGNNRISGNGTTGTGPTAAGGPTSDLGQQ